MRIAMVAAAWEVDADERRTHIVELSAELGRRGHDVTLYLRDQWSPPVRQRRDPKSYRVVRVPAGPATGLSKADLVPHLDEFAAFLKDEWSERRPDVAHLHSWMSGLAVPAGRHVPLVQSYHGLGFLERRFRNTDARERTAVERLVGRAAHRVLAAGSEEMFALVRLGVHRSRMSLVPCAVDVDLFQPDGPAVRSGSRPRLLAFGDVAPHSGFHTAISALPLVPDAELVIVGRIRHPEPLQDPEVKRLVLHARGLDVADRVTFAGPVEHARRPALLRSADVVLCPPWYESFGAAALEAMACGVPVVAAAVGALNDVVIDGATGVLVPPRDPRALGHAVRELLADGTRRQVCAIAGADRARARYSWDRVAAEAVAAYEKARVPARADLSTVEDR